MPARSYISLSTNMAPLRWRLDCSPYMLCAAIFQITFRNASQARRLMCIGSISGLSCPSAPFTRNDKAVQRLGFLCEKFYQDNCPDEDDERAMERFEQKREAHKELYFHLGGGRSIEILKKMMRETCKHFRRW